MEGIKYYSHSVCQFTVMNNYCNHYYYYFSRSQILNITCSIWIDFAVRVLLPALRERALCFTNNNKVI